MKTKFDPTKFYALYDDNDKCVAVFDNLDELIASGLICVKVKKGITRRGFEQMCCRWGQKNGREQTRITEGNKVYCSQKIYQYVKYKTQRQGVCYGYSVYKFWEEEVA